MTRARVPNRAFERVVCIGLDGATFDVVDPMIQRGKLPNLARLIDQGVRSNLASTVPPLTAPAWVSFMTGLNPGRHGVFHFRSIENGALGDDLVGSWMFRGNTIFDRASRAGLRVASFRVPMTYPAWQINGVMVSGFPTPDPQTNFSSPPEVGERMDPLVKLTPVSSMMAGLEAQIENFEFYIERSTAVIVDMLKKEQPDLFCYVNSITDWVAHKFWRFSDPGAPGYEPYPTSDGNTLLEHFYALADESLGAILEAAGDDALRVVLSDHGTGPRTNARFNTNAWLAERGLLARDSSQRTHRMAAGAAEWLKDVMPKKHWVWRKLPSSVRRSTGALRAYGGAITWQETRAYRAQIDHHVEGVNVNLEGREPQGCVPGAQFDSVRREVAAAALELRDPVTGAQVIERACLREELYEGEHSSLAPDVILILNPAYEAGHGAVSGVFTRVADSRLGRSSATHRPNGIFVAAGPGVRSGADLGGASLLDVPPTLLWALGLDVPPMDGEFLARVFERSTLETHPVRHGTDDVEASAGQSYSKEEEEQVAAHLRELGYL